MTAQDMASPSRMHDHHTDQPVLELESVTRSYGTRDRRRVVVDGLTMRVHAGSVVCLLGPNGAGKTTTIKMASTLLLPDSGSVRICGIDAIADPYRGEKHLSLLLGGERGFYLRASAIDNLRFFAQLAGVSHRDVEPRIRESLEAVGLEDKADARVETFSRGMKQRLHIARAMCSHASLVLLDEPTTGLDPHSALRIRELIADMRRGGAGIVLTTHAMAEAEALADRIHVIREGRIIVSGSVRDLADSVRLDGVSMYMAFESEWNPDAANRLRGIPGVRGVNADLRGGVWSITVTWQGAHEPDAELIRQAAASPELRHLGWRPASLEEVYLAVLDAGREG
ncbi:ABC transporter ATP-binding protein [Bifidobacterium biavatii]|nr:ABC transporter ATP-binding protein [Bifidobacterium biavatii]